MQLLIISGKGGTGKTTIAAAISKISQCQVAVDCDVEAANLYLLLQKEELRRKGFAGAKQAHISSEMCTSCGICSEVCRFAAINRGKVEPLSCEGCGSCVYHCPQKALRLEPEQTAEVVRGATKWGSLLWADMVVGAEGSGKLVTQLRGESMALDSGGTIVVLDGSPGIGCPVMASITGCDAALIVTEPSSSGLSDLKRIVSLLKQFNMRCFVSINKYDLSAELSDDMVKYCESQGILVVGKLPFDPLVKEAVRDLKSILDFPNSLAAQSLIEMYDKLDQLLRGKNE